MSNKVVQESTKDNTNAHNSIIKAESPKSSEKHMTKAIKTNTKDPIVFEKNHSKAVNSFILKNDNGDSNHIVDHIKNLKMHGGDLITNELQRLRGKYMTLGKEMFGMDKIFRLLIIYFGVTKSNVFF